MQFDEDIMSLEDSLTKAFDAVIRLQVDPVWNQLVRIQVEMGLMTGNGPKTELLVNDLLVCSIPNLGL